MELLSKPVGPVQSATERSFLCLTFRLRNHIPSRGVVKGDSVSAMYGPHTARRKEVRA